MHLHHIVPKHMGGTDDPSNLRELTVEEHAEAHRQLWLQYGRWQDRLAWQGLAGIIGKEEIVAEQNRLKSLGKPHSEEHKAKIRAYRHTPEAIDKIRANHKGMLGRKHSPEAKEKMRLARLGKKFPRGTP